MSSKSLKCMKFDVNKLIELFKGIKYNKKIIIATQTIIFLLFFNYIFRNISLFSNYLNIDRYFFIFIIPLIAIRILLNSFQLQILYRYLNLKLSIVESINIHLSFVVYNLVTFFGAGTSYKMIYLKTKHNLPFKKYLKVNAVYTFFKVLLYIFLSIIVFYLNFDILKILILSLLLSLIIYLLFKFQIVSNKKNFQNYTTSLILISIFQFFINIYVLFFYFKSFNFNQALTNLTSYFISGFISDLIKITPGNLGFKEIILIQTKFIHSIPENQILTVTLFVRFFEGLLYVTIFYLFKYVIDKIQN